MNGRIPVGPVSESGRARRRGLRSLLLAYATALAVALALAGALRGHGPHGGELPALYY